MKKIVISNQQTTPPQQQRKGEGKSINMPTPTALTFNHLAHSHTTKTNLLYKCSYIDHDDLKEKYATPSAT